MSSSSEGRAASTLRYDVEMPYALASDGLRLPRLRVDVLFFPEQRQTAPVVPLLDTGAEFSMFDGALAEQAGWPVEEIAARALDVRPIYGFSRGSRPVQGYVHEVTCYVAFGARFAELRFRAVITPPSTLAFPVLGRAGFFEQVDVTFAELEKRLYLRFRNPALGRLFA